MNKSKEAYKTIGEVAKELGVSPHVLRFWENKFDRLKLIKRKNNHRYYNEEDISFLLNVKKLIDEEGYTIKGVQIYLSKEVKKTNSPSNNEKEYLQIINEIKIDINNIINN